MQFFDLHVHTNPDRFDRRYSQNELAKELIKTDSCAVIKSHITGTTSPDFLQSKNLYGSVVLNEYVGGISLSVVKSCYALSQNQPFIIWFPTMTGLVRAKLKQKFSCPVFNVPNIPINRVSTKGVLLPEVLKIISFAAEHDITIATGHASKAECYMLVSAAKELGCRLIVTHPFYKLTNFTVFELAAIADEYANVFFECSILMNKMGYESYEDDIKLIKSIGITRVFTSSDFGQQQNETVSEGFAEYVTGIKKVSVGTITDDMIHDLVYSTPKTILYGTRKKERAKSKKH
ncbi:MAG: DUF6282 family protein [Leuconostoc gelidum]|jgi:hypothetical protein|uniref:DUF6282 family protein n=1 Tax=Leuconostoc gelidum TaxID=1244 RepID=UPI001575D471|nr:DUF6282 family protein [Leuconostoc gelidum]MBZ5978765.1 hypothetical protein [Leuconostoc gelidum subsp. gelidum]MBZ6001775.1 hypothetical protein [Leuconostoc gelidum subsp. gelidum]QDJ29236.1 hypothetical protein BHS02_00480 [Leuconostoc gelidum subsp. gelidum]